MNDASTLQRLVDALENIAASLERLELLKEYELKAQVVHDEHGNPVVKKRVGH